MLETIDPFGQRRDDVRMAVLAQVIVQALGAKKADGKAYTAEDFLRALDRGAAGTAPRSETQTAAQIEQRIAMWVGGNNRAWHEDPARGGR